MLRVLLCLVIVVLLLPAVANAGLPSLIPRKVLFGNPVKAAPQVSPDGLQLTYLAPDKNDVLQVWVQTVGKEDSRQVTADKKRGIRVHRWTYAPDTLLYMQDADGDENWHIYSVNLKSAVVRDLTPFQGVRADVLDLDRDHPNELLAGLNLTNRRVFDVYRIDLTTGAVVLDTKNPGDVLGWEADPKFRVRACTAATPDGGREIRYRADDRSDDWKTVVRWGPDDAD
ncbi:MAG TPA: S9 family peptidase, partial [Gemmataceae bacterium]|nr:S9 family peptidase [Gemmataceae bacterium]